MQARRNGPPRRAVVLRWRKLGGVAALDRMVESNRARFTAAQEHLRTCLPCDVPHARRVVYSAREALEAAIESREKIALALHQLEIELREQNDKPDV